MSRHEFTVHRNDGAKMYVKNVVYSSDSLRLTTLVTQLFILIPASNESKEPMKNESQSPWPERADFIDKYEQQMYRYCMPR